MNDDAIGIDALAACVPDLYLDLTGEWAQVRAPELGEPSVEKLVGKVVNGVGVRKMAVPDANEDAATLAATAARRVIDHAGISPEDIDYVAIGTETTVDQSKSMSAYVLGMLARHYQADLSACGAPQFQFACIGATYALEAAVSRIRAGDNEKPYALVIATDISKYPLRSAAEYTQGAGAVAMLVSRAPRMLALERAHGTVTRDERDFFRPNWRRTAVVDGKYSIDVYLDLLREAWAAYEARESRGASAAEHLLFHVPFPRMAEYALSSVLLPAGADGPRREAERAFAKTDAFRAVMAAKVEPSLAHAREVGNVYSGSLYLALLSLAEHGAVTEGQRVVLSSYGSGASAKVFGGSVRPSWGEAFAPLGPSLAGRRALSVAEYEALHAREDVDAGGEVLSVPPALSPGGGRFRLERLGDEQGPKRTDVGYRYYR